MDLFPWNTNLQYLKLHWHWHWDWDWTPVTEQWHRRHRSFKCSFLIQWPPQTTTTTCNTMVSTYTYMTDTILGHNHMFSLIVPLIIGRLSQRTTPPKVFLKTCMQKHMAATASSEAPYSLKWHQVINTRSNYIHCLKSRLALNAKVEHLSQLACRGTDETFSLLWWRLS